MGIEHGIGWEEWPETYQDYEFMYKEAEAGYERTFWSAPKKATFCLALAEGFYTAMLLLRL